MNKFKDKKVGVLLGGLSRERPVSLRSGAAIAKGLRNRGYSVVEIDADQNLPERLREESVDVAFLALHGRYGEDGCVQGLLEWMQIPYTGSGVLSSAIAMDKASTKRLLQERGFLTPFFSIFDQQLDLKEEFLKNFSMGFPLIVKPACEGSTFGIEVIKKKEELKIALDKALLFDSKVLFEEWISGKEVTAGVLIDRPLPLVEIRPKSGFYDFESKYTVGATDYLVPATLSDLQTQEIQQMTLQIFAELGCSGCARADYIVDAQGQIFFLEINTLPGMTETSLIPKAGAHIGLSFEDLVEEILDSARLHLRRAL